MEYIFDLLQTVYYIIFYYFYVVPLYCYKIYTNRWSKIIVSIFPDTSCLKCIQLMNIFDELNPEYIRRYGNIVGLYNYRKIKQSDPDARDIYEEHIFCVINLCNNYSPYVQICEDCLPVL